MKQLSEGSLVVQVFRPSRPVASRFEVPIPAGDQTSARGVVKLAMRFRLTVERTDVVSHLFTVSVKCPAPKSDLGPKPPYSFARPPEDERSIDRVAHALNADFRKPAHGSVRRYLSLADAHLVRFLANGYFLATGERDLGAAVLCGRNCHRLILGHPRLGEKRAQEQSNQEHTPPDHRHQSSPYVNFRRPIEVRNMQRHPAEVVGQDGIGVSTCPTSRHPPSLYFARLIKERRPLQIQDQRGSYYPPECSTTPSTAKIPLPCELARWYPLSGSA